MTVVAKVHRELNDSTAMVVDVAMNSDVEVQAVLAVIVSAETAVVVAVDFDVADFDCAWN